MLNRPNDGGPIQDGFLLNPSWAPLPGSYNPLALAGMDTIRRANQVQAKWISLPEQLESVAAYDTYRIDTPIIPGSVLWGLIFTELDGAGGDVIEPENALLRITDACTGLRILNDFAAALPFSNYATGSRLPRGLFMPYILPEPYMIVTPGRLMIEIANQSDATIYPRLVLMLAEPCDMSAYTVVPR